MKPKIPVLRTMIFNGKPITRIDGSVRFPRKSQPRVPSNG